MATEPAGLRTSAPTPIRLPLARPSLSDPRAAAERIARLLEGPILTDGDTVRELEARAAAYLGVRHCVAVASCTTGLLLVLRAAGVDGEVITPSFTFAATAHAIAWNGARPVFADIDPFTLTVDPVQVAAAVSTRTSAILATHLY